MDKATITKFTKSINKMRAKVVETKGEAVKGLSSVVSKKEQTVSDKSRGANS